MEARTTPTFDRALKKLHTRQKAALDRAVLKILENPLVGDAKVGDLAGIYVYKFRCLSQVWLLAYRDENSESIKLLVLGSHENFYRDLKRH
jgi:mRNA interferase RelE/StbE